MRAHLHMSDFFRTFAAAKVKKKQQTIIYIHSIMKKIILFATALIMAGCGFQQAAVSNNQQAATQQTAATTTQSSNAAMSAGQGAGTALQALYKQYKADGKYDYKNMQNILNTVTLISNCDGLKENYKDTSYLTEFGKGLIASSLGLVNQNNVTTVTNSLVDMVKNSESVQSISSQAQSTASQAAQYANTAAQYAGSISSLLSLFSK